MPTPTKPNTHPHVPHPSLCNTTTPNKQLGEGAFGQVYLCVHRKTREKCAVKIVDLARLNVDDARHLEDEIDILKVGVLGERVCVGGGL